MMECRQKTNKSNYYIESYHHSEGVEEKSWSKNVGNNVLTGYYRAKDKNDYT